MSAEIDRFLTENPTQKVVVIGNYELNTTSPIRGNSSIKTAQGKFIPYGFFDGLSSSEMKLNHFILSADLPTQLSFEFEQRIIARGVLAFDKAEDLLNHLKT
jgi:hypothetical protein